MLLRSIGGVARISCQCFSPKTCLRGAERKIPEDTQSFKTGLLAFQPINCFKQGLPLLILSEWWPYDVPSGRSWCNVDGQITTNRRPAVAFSTQYSVVDSSSLRGQLEKAFACHSELKQHTLSRQPSAPLHVYLQNTFCYSYSCTVAGTSPIDMPRVLTTCPWIFGSLASHWWTARY